MEEGMTKEERQRFIDMMMDEFGLTYEEAALKLLQIEGIHPSNKEVDKQD